MHLELFPDLDESRIDHALEAHVEKLLALRGIVAQALESAVQLKQISKSPDGAVTLLLGDPSLLATLRQQQAEIEEFFIRSDFTLIAGAETKATIVPTTRRKCARCWRHRLNVGANPEHPDLCERCTEVVTAAPAVLASTAS